jgi:hypothetical protein
MTEKTLYVARIIESASGEVVAQSEPTYLRRAEKIEAGMGINLNWEQYHTDLVESDEREES